MHLGIVITDFIDMQGILKTYNNIPCKFKAHDLGVANDYDSRF